MDERRWHERFSCECVGELTARDRGGRPDRRKLIIRSVSERGLGAHLVGDAGDRLAKGTQVVIRLPGFGGLLELPGRIVWSERTTQPSPISRIGIVLFVEIAPSATRHLFATWFSDVTARHKAEAPTPSAAPTAAAARAIFRAGLHRRRADRQA